MKASLGVAAVALATLSACSLTFMTPPGEPTPGRPAPECTPSSALPLLDIGWTLFYAGVFVVSPLLRSESSPDAAEPPSLPYIRGVTPLLAAAHAVSAWSGTVSAERCLAQRYAARAAPTDPPARPRLEMWCTRTPTRAACTLTEGHCDRLRGELAPDGTAPLCDATEPVCFRVDGALRVCAPDAASCARERDIYDARSPGKHELSPCARPATTAAASAPRAAGASSGPGR